MFSFFILLYKNDWGICTNNEQIMSLLYPTSLVILSANSRHWVVILQVYSTQDQTYNVIDLYI